MNAKIKTALGASLFALAAAPATAADYRIGISGDVPVVCRVTVETNAAPEGTLGRMQEFCNNGRGYKVSARTDDARSLVRRPEPQARRLQRPPRGAVGRRKHAPDAVGCSRDGIARHLAAGRPERVPVFPHRAAIAATAEESRSRGSRPARSRRREAAIP